VERLAATSSLVISQQKEWGEILSGFETKNKYVVFDEVGNQLYLAAEESGSTMARWFLKALRPFTISVLSNDGQLVLQVNRPFEFYFHRADIVDAEGRLLGTIQRRFSMLRRIYSVLDAHGEYFELFNAGDTAVDLNDWLIKDADTNSHQIVAAGGLIIPPGGFIVLGHSAEQAENGHVEVDYAYGSAITLANKEDEILLIDPTGKTIDEVRYSEEQGFDIPTGASISVKNPLADNNQSAAWCVEESPWPGSAGDSGTPGLSPGCS